VTIQGYVEDRSAMRQAENCALCGIQMRQKRIQEQRLYRHFISNNIIPN